MSAGRGKFRGLREQTFDGTSAAGLTAKEAKEARAEVDREIDDRLAKLTPATRLLFDRIRPAITDALVRRVEGRKPAFCFVRIASPEWRHCTFEAVAMALEDAVRTEFMIYGVRYQHIPGDDFSDRSWQRKKPAERTQHVLSMLATGITIVALPIGEELDGAVTAIADLDIDLSRIEASELEAAVRRAFPESACPWPEDIAVSKIEPRWIDLAVGRSASTEEAFRMIAAILGRQEPAPGGVTAPRLEDLHGYGEAGQWGRRLVAALKDHQAGRISWTDVDAGALLVGPPGTGKTLFASALARSADVAFFPTSYSAWQGTGEGHLGDVVRAIRKSFSEAAANTPCIIFIDEVDSVPARSSGHHRDDWWRTIVNCLLECLDGTGRREGVVVLAACNDDTGLDPALVRSGRLDRRFHIGLPREDDLLKILGHHLPMIPEGEIQPAAVTLAGSTSGADAARIARDVRQRARSQGRGPTGSDLLTVALPTDNRPEALRRRIAVHEAGHAVAIFCQGQIPSSLSIVASGGGAVILERQETELVLGDLNDQLAINLAGRAAEEVILGSVSAGAGGTADSDLGQSTKLVMMIEGRLGLGSRIGVVDRVEEMAIERRLRLAYADALLAAMRNRRAIEALAELALERRVLGRTALSEFWSAIGPISLSNPQ